MSLEKVQQALLTTLVNAFGVTWSGRVSYENIAFTAPDGKPWLAVHFMPADERIATLGPNGIDTADGIFQVTVNVPKGTGEGVVRTTVNALRSAFKPQVIAFQGQSVTILSRSRANGGIRDDFYVVPFSVRWRSQLSRT